MSEDITWKSSKVYFRGEDLKEVCGLNGRLFLEFFPQMEDVIGAQPPLEELAPNERKYRFHKLITDLFVMLLRTTNITLVCYPHWM